MRSITIANRDWLNDRFMQVSHDGIYQSHAPIYGFRDINNTTWINPVFYYRILSKLNKLSFGSLLDVGGAEGYQAYIISKILSKDVLNSDLSIEACKRCKEIFNIESNEVDIQKLPYKDNEFEVVLCTETLEHVDDFKTGLNEIIRVAKKAVLITVPNDSYKKIKKNLEENIQHVHLHKFKKNTIKNIVDKKYQIYSERFNNKFLRFLLKLIEAKKLNYKNHSHLIIDCFNYIIKILPRIIDENMAIILYNILIPIDFILSNLFCRNDSFIILILKDDSVLKKGFSIRRKVILNKYFKLRVPYYYMNKND